MSTLARPFSGTVFDAPPPPDELAPDTFAARLYAMLAPLAQHDPDPDVAWSLLIFCNALGTMFQLVEDWARDTADGPGWSLLVDVERCPPEALDWLAQFVGVRTLPDSSDDEKRARIASTDGFRRGTLAALEGAAASTLTGDKHVTFRERSHDPLDKPDCAYYLSAFTYQAETPDATATLNAILAQKPGGIVLTYAAVTGQDYQSVETKFATYQAVRDAYVDYSAMRIDLP